MTESEAIEELKHSIVSYEVQNRNNITCDLTREVLNMAINALEKQEKIKEIIANANKWSKEDIVVKAQAFFDIKKLLRSDEE